MTSEARNNSSSSSSSSNADIKDQQLKQQGLRIACLTPSATDICIALGLQEHIVGITHECTWPSSSSLSSSSSSSSMRVLTADGGVAAERSSQGEIHNRVSLVAKSQTQQTQQQFQNNNNNIIDSEDAQIKKDIPSLYPILGKELLAAAPTIVLTQDLCAVCAPSSASVRSILLSSSSSSSPPVAADTNDDSNSNNKSNRDSRNIQIVSLSPNNLKEVAESFVTVAAVCGIPQRGMELQRQFLQEKLQTLRNAILQARQQQQPKFMLFLEWLDPPFDGGHWIPDLMYYAGVVPASLTPTTTNTASTSDNNQNDDSIASCYKKSTTLSWQQVDTASSHADVVLIACCGMNLQRNVTDAMQYYCNRNTHNNTNPTSMLQQQPQPPIVFAANGDLHFARPGPDLWLGAVIMAVTAYQDDPAVLQAISQLSFVPRDMMNPQNSMYWHQVVIDKTTVATTVVKSHDSTTTNSPCTSDIEDWDVLHERAVQRGEFMYTDPATGYSVFTELAHLQRGKCCGSGCRHCPFAHENVQTNDKASKIQQPAVLHHVAAVDESSTTTTTTQPEEILFALHKDRPIRVLFFSGGKDSFLTLRALVRQQQQQKQQQHALEQQPFGLVLLTTFDAKTRMVAHQDVSMDTIVQQAQHLNVSLVGVPLHNRQGGDAYYVQRLQKALHNLLQDQLGYTIHSLVFGDLHLESIRQWRDNTLGPLGYPMVYPLFGIPYEDLLCDLEASQVPCVITAVSPSAVSSFSSSSPLSSHEATNGVVKIGTVFDRQLFQALTTDPSCTVDGFGENGEFHSVAQVWKVDRAQALGF